MVSAFAPESRPSRGLLRQAFVFLRGGKGPAAPGGEAEGGVGGGSSDVDD